MAMLQHPYHHRDESYKYSRNTAHQSSISHSIDNSTSVPTLIVRYCVRVVARSGHKSVFNGGNTEHLDMSERPFHSVWYGHANLTPETLLPSTYDNNPIQDIGIEQSFEWLAKAAIANTPLVPCDPQGRNMTPGSEA